MGKLVTFTTDFGWSIAAGICRGVIKKICPDADLIDLTHSIPHYDIEAGAASMMDAVPYLPVGIHVVVVDPGVGSVRRPVAVRARRGDIFIGPDNGVLSLAIRAAGGAEAAHVIASPKVILTPTSNTFHGRDIFAPAAAHLAAGMPLTELGPAIEPAGLTTIDYPDPRVEGEAAMGILWGYDPFGSARTNLTSATLDAVGLKPGVSVRIAAGGRTIELPLLRTFSDVPVGEACCLIDSSDRFCIAVNQGSARDRFGLAPKSPLRVTALTPRR